MPLPKPLHECILGTAVTALAVVVNGHSLKATRRGREAWYGQLVLACACALPAACPKGMYMAMGHFCTSEASGEGVNALLAAMPGDVVLLEAMGVKQYNGRADLTWWPTSQEWGGFSSDGAVVSAV